MIFPENCYTYEGLRRASLVRGLRPSQDYVREGVHICRDSRRDRRPNVLG
jgi:hypothetical protein